MRIKLNKARYLIVGAGFFGATIAERIANDMNKAVIVIDKRDHVGGNCYSFIDNDTGIECHKYGTHIFHTSNKVVWDYLSKFTNFNNYQHKVFTCYQDKIYTMPINLNTINVLYGVNLRPESAKKFLMKEIKKENIKNPSNFEEKAISLIGRPLYEAFIKGYTIKQWEEDPCKLPSDIITRLPIRFNYNNNYFSDFWQGLPIDGYTEVFNRMLNHRNITLHLNTDFIDIVNHIPSDCVIIYTGPIDAFFNYKYGKMGWRTLRFEIRKPKIDDYQGTSVMNYADRKILYTRCHEFKHLHQERSYKNASTYIAKEYSKSVVGKHEEPYYPINRTEDMNKLSKYLTEAAKLKNMIFGGRLGLYKYLDMDRTIEIALNTYGQFIKEKR